VNYLREPKLSSAANELIEFDADSIRRLGGNPDVWLVDPDQYEKNGRLLRDSESHRMVAYSTRNQVLYATDGCNSCIRAVPARLETLQTEALETFAKDNEIHSELLQRLVALLALHGE
jgi:hypothetical protein